MAFEYSTITLFLELALSQSSHTISSLHSAREIRVGSPLLAGQILVLRNSLIALIVEVDAPEWFSGSVLVSSELISVTVSEFSIVTPLPDNPSRRPSTSLNNRAVMPCLHRTFLSSYQLFISPRGGPPSRDQEAR
ncbi:hypothetical protein CEP53_006846 [Fusarium sp. AF-6]|nr:hypothetical protein CEP53_006846 [Fusarium sp. AF-6]